MHNLTISFFRFPFQPAESSVALEIATSITTRGNECNGVRLKIIATEYKIACGWKCGAFKNRINIIIDVHKTQLLTSLSKNFYIIFTIGSDLFLHVEYII